MERLDNVSLDAGEKICGIRRWSIISGPDASTKEKNKKKKLKITANIYAQEGKRYHNGSWFDIHNMCAYNKFYKQLLKDIENA